MNTQIINPVRKGDIVALEELCTYMALRGPSGSYSRWRLAIVASASREGRVKRIQALQGDYSLAIEHMGRVKVHTLPNHQDRARQLMAESGRQLREYSSADALRAALTAGPTYASAAE